MRPIASTQLNVVLKTVYREVRREIVARRRRVLRDSPYPVRASAALAMAEAQLAAASHRRRAAIDDLMRQDAHATLPPLPRHDPDAMRALVRRAIADAEECERHDETPVYF